MVPVQAQVVPSKPKRALAVRNHLSPRTQAPEAAVVTLFCLWLFLQCFDYKAMPWFRWNLGIVISPDRLMLCILLAALAALPARREERHEPRHTAAVMLGVFLLLFSFVGALSLWISAPDADSTTFGHLTRLTNIAFIPAFSFFAARRLRYTRAMLKQILQFLAALGVYLSFTAVCEHFGVRALIFPKYILDPHVGIHFGRSRGPFVDTIGNGGMLLISCLALACISSGFSGVKRFLSFCLVLLAIPAIYFTETRAVWLGLAAIIATSAVLRTSLRTGSAFIAAAVFIGFLSGVGSKFSVSENTLFSRRQNTVDYRLDNYQTAWNAFTDNPLFGVGFGKFHLEWSSYFKKADSRTRGLDDGNHSTPLGILAELGAAGFVPFLSTVVCAFFVCVAAYGRTRNYEYEFERRFVLLALGAIITFVILGLTNDLHSTPVVNATALWLVGIVSTIRSEGAASNAARSGRAVQAGDGVRTDARERPCGSSSAFEARGISGEERQAVELIKHLALRPHGHCIGVSDPWGARASEKHHRCRIPLSQRASSSILLGSAGPHGHQSIVRTRIRRKHP